MFHNSWVYDAHGINFSLMTFAIAIYKSLIFELAVC